MIIRLGNVKLSLAKNRDAAFVPKADFIRLVTDPHGVYITKSYLESHHDSQNHAQLHR